jgi:hypothetical protein
MQEELKQEKTSFRSWRIQMGLSLTKAAQALDLSRSQIVNFDRGICRTTGKEVSPHLSIRVLMKELAEFGKANPWPE